MVAIRQRLAAYTERRRSRRDARAATEQEKHRIQLRRFAGPEAYANVLDRPIRVAHLTDQHVGLVTPLKVQLEAATIANREKPDIVVLTGDFVCHSHAYLDQLVEVVRAFDAPVFGVLGNHDYWAGASGVRRALRKGNVELLKNANTVITIGSQRLQLVGLDDAYTGHADRAKATKGMRRNLPTLGLSHIAEEADGLWSDGIPFVLSGHTHGGQLSVAKLNELMLGRVLKHRYIHGMYGSRDASTDVGSVYVGAGIGAAVMPLRLGDRGSREVTIFELGAAPGSVPEHHGDQNFTPLAEDHCEDTARREAKRRFVERQRRKNGKKRKR